MDEWKFKAQTKQWRMIDDSILIEFKSGEEIKFPYDDLVYVEVTNSKDIADSKRAFIIAGKKPSRKKKG